MPILPNSKHELFAQSLASGKTADEAYALAGYNPHRSNAARLSANEHVRSRVEEILTAAAERAGITRERIQEALSKIAFTESDGVKHGDQLKALELLGKDIGMFKDRLEHSGPGGGPIQSVAMNAGEFEAVAKRVADEI